VSRHPLKTAQSRPFPLEALPFLKSVPEGILLNIRVQPGARKSAWVGLMGEEIKLSIQAPPVEGAANQGCLTFLAQWFKVKRSQVILLKGEKGRSKVFLIKGLTLEKGRSLIPTQSPDQLE
jgi:uncharacterized protein (TIGR00251 family)